MSSLVLDTHSAIWYLEKSTSLSKAGREAINAAAATGQTIFVSSISLIEITYLVEKSKLLERQYGLLLDRLTDPEAGWQVVPIDLEVTRKIAQISRALVPDMPDRIIAATALHLDLPLVTRDANLRNCGLKTIW